MTAPLNYLVKSGTHIILAFVIGIASIFLGGVAHADALDASELATGNQAIIREPTNNGVTLYSAPDLKAARITELTSGVAVRLTAGPITNQTNIWWRIRG